MDTLLILLAIPVGLVAGGFVTMLVDRVPDGLSVLGPGPRCPYCEHPLGLAEIVPVVSWLRLGRSCGHCEHPVTPSYPAVELVTAALFLVAVLRFEATWVVLPYWVFFAALVAACTIDLYRYRIPDRIVFPALGLGVLLIGAVSIYYGEPAAIGRAAIGALIFFVVLLVPHLLYPKGMGVGDVKLALLLGLHIGWIGSDAIVTLRLVLFALIIASVLGVAGGFLLAALRRRTGRDLLPDPDAERSDEVDGDTQVVVRTMAATAFPFGPALAAATVVTIVFSHQLV